MINTRSIRPVAQAARARTSDKPKAQVWLNVGYEANGRFVNLPFGLPIDTLEHLKVSGQDEDWKALRTSQNALIDFLRNAGLDLAPGEEVDVDLQLRLRRAKDETPVETGENPYAMDLSSLVRTAA